MSEIDPRLLSDLTVEGVSRARQEQKTDQTTEEGKDFSEVLEEELADSSLEFSSHAKRRLKSRGIELNQQRLQQIEQTLQRVKNKGGRDALVMLSDAALLVSAENDTVITALDPQDMDQRVVTDIDSAAWAESSSNNGTDAASGGGSPAGGTTDAGRLGSQSGGRY